MCSRITSSKGVTQLRVIGMDSYTQRYVCEDMSTGKALDVDTRANTKAPHIPTFAHTVGLLAESRINGCDERVYLCAQFTVMGPAVLTKVLWLLIFSFN